jgi:hypothetical protein
VLPSREPEAQRLPAEALTRAEVLKLRDGLVVDPEDSVIDPGWLSTPMGS